MNASDLAKPNLRTEAMDAVAGDVLEEEIDSR